MINLYWPIYKNLEKEIVELSDLIHFDDQQLNVYSVKISELLIRCSVEIEAIAKDLYLQNGGTKENNNDLFFDTDCLDFLEEKWDLSKKKIIVSSSNFFFTNSNNRIFTPLNKANKRGSSGSKWKKAYQAVKHNRTTNLQKGNLENLLKATGALFLLNLYYRNDTFELKKINNADFAENLSNIFNVKVHTWRGDDKRKGSYVKKEDFEECVYLVKWTDDYKSKMNTFSIEQNKHLNELIFKHPKISNYINNNLVEEGKIKQAEFTKFIEKREYFKLLDMEKEYAPMINLAAQKAKEKLNFDWFSPSEFEGILNKKQQIYRLPSP
ncbi:hypothetical protein LDL76_12605 [Salegentibacter mishustinae]|uniref:hypothetical protein n=1 Tax=Salegentibacter mishustinae TaxID=270918 RepID=UPI001CE09EA4|nr:hypothetical protein [Salegentibacter mishustinae]UBZ06196.1 hypothetical protein LDL76_12605 [Salegentibacter mishustinae]